VYYSLSDSYPYAERGSSHDTTDSPAVTIRTVFPETWIWELAEVGYLKHNTFNIIFILLLIFNTSSPPLTHWIENTLLALQILNPVFCALNVVY